jgi:DNA-binding response OmpR family regulator
MAMTTFFPRVLVVDDDRDLADFLVEALSLHRLNARCAYGGAEALQVADGYRPDALLLDLGMLNIDGFDVAAAMRRGAASPRLVALSSLDDPGTRARAKAAGFDVHLPKPSSIATIVAAVQGLAPQ